MTQKGWKNFLLSGQELGKKLCHHQKEERKRRRRRKNLPFETSSL
jgi:hypothetical protein